MAASDFGICNNGEALFECLAMHLPVLVADNLSKFDSYRCLRMDSFLTDFNKHANGEYVPELVAMNNSRKVVELWSEWIIKPSLKYSLIDAVFEFLPDFLPFQGPEYGFTENRIDYMLTPKPDVVLSHELMSLVDKYRFLNGQPPEMNFEVRTGQFRTDVLFS